MRDSTLTLLKVEFTLSFTLSYSNNTICVKIINGLITWLSVLAEYMARSTSTKRSNVVPGSRVSSLQKLRNFSLRQKIQKHVTHYSSSINIQTAMTLRLTYLRSLLSSARPWRRWSLATAKMSAAPSSAWNAWSALQMKMKCIIDSSFI